jgi:hypothetical protein
MTIEHFDLATFKRTRFNYKPGQHVSFIGPTQQAGKSTLSFALQEGLVSEELPAIGLCMKHTDRVVAHWTKRLDYQETPVWPPKIPLQQQLRLQPKPAGYMVWPQQTLTDVEADNKNLEKNFKAASVYARLHVPHILFADEIYGLIAELDMRKLLTAIITRDSGAGLGMWYATQKPSGTQGVSMPGFLYNSPTWTFLSKDGDERNRSRYGEIGCGISPKAIEREVLALDKYSWLCINREGPFWCVLDAYDPSLAA